MAIRLAALDDAAPPAEPPPPDDLDPDEAGALLFEDAVFDEAEVAGVLAVDLLDDACADPDDEVDTRETDPLACWAGTMELIGEMDEMPSICIYTLLQTETACTFLYRRCGLEPERICAAWEQKDMNFPASGGARVIRWTI